MFDDTYASTRDALHRVAVHVVARARQQATGRFSLRVTPGGLGTPEHGPALRRVRIAGSALVLESDAPGNPAASAHPIAGATLRGLAAAAGADLTTALDVGHDTPDLGDVDAPITIDESAATELGRVFGSIGAVLDRLLVALAAEGLATTTPRLWPEHFDVAVETDVLPGRRVNLGGSPGDGFCQGPYVYVGPWTAQRPGDPSFWNAPFGALHRLDAVDDDATAGALAFLLEGVEHLRSR